MKKATQYSVTMINQHKSNLEDELIDSIYDMLSEEDGNLEIDLTISASRRFKYLELEDGENCDLEQVYVEVEYLEEDGLYYSGTCRVEELDVAELYYLWKYLNEWK